MMGVGEGLAGLLRYVRTAGLDGEGLMNSLGTVGAGGGLGQRISVAGMGPAGLRREGVVLTGHDQLLGPQDWQGGG